MPPSPAPEKKTRGTWIRWLILPLLLGASTAVLIARTEKLETEIAISATFDNLADDLLLTDIHEKSIRLVVSGTSSALKTISPAEATCRVDLSGLREGEHTIAVHQADVSLPEGVALLSLLTPSVTVRMEAASVKKVPVIAVLEGNTAPGFTVASVVLKPNHVILNGTATMLKGIETVKTRPINLEAAAESFKKEVPLNLPETIALTPPLRIVVAEIEVKERIITRVLENIPVAGKGTSAGYQVNPPVISLTVSGPESIINTIETDSAFAVSVDLVGLSQGTHSLKATINLPVRIALKRVSPERFSVTINK